MGKKKAGSKLFNSQIKQASAKIFSPQPIQDSPVTKKLTQRSVRHYQEQTVSIIKHSLQMMAPKIDAQAQERQQDHDYSNAVSAIKVALHQLADTLADILVEDPQEEDTIQHHDLLANYFQMPGTHHNGVHLVASSNIEALAEDLALHKNTREYRWLMTNGVNLLEYEILTKISYEMSHLEKGHAGSTDCQQERAIELEDIISNTHL